MRRMRANSSLIVAIVILLVSPARAVATDPDPVSPTEYWGQDNALQFQWDNANLPPGWMQGPISDAFDDAIDTRASRAPDFSYSTSGEGVIKYLDRLHLRRPDLAQD